jgi:hypothetical protein
MARTARDAVEIRRRTMKSETGETLRQAAQRLRTSCMTHHGHRIPMADLLDKHALAADRAFAAVQSPSAGVDLPPGIAYGDPVKAEEIVASQQRALLAVAREILAESVAA